MEKDGTGAAMDYEEIGDLIGEIKFHYVETGTWDSAQCARLLELTQHVPLIVGRKRGIHCDDLNDIVQQSYQAAFKYLSQLADDRSFPRYLYTISENLCRRYWQKRIKSGYQEDFFFDDGREKCFTSTITDFENEHVRENLRDAIDQLPDIYKQTIEMFYFAGMKACEIATAMQVSINTVTSRVRRARKLLKDILEA
jgi:RNA polymerase sigma-70 factor, ECF subfamily